MKSLDGAYITEGTFALLGRKGVRVKPREL